MYRYTWCKTNFSSSYLDKNSGRVSWPQRKSTSFSVPTNACSQVRTFSFSLSLSLSLTFLQTILGLIVLGIVLSMSPRSCMEGKHCQVDAKFVLFGPNIHLCFIVIGRHHILSACMKIVGIRIREYKGLGESVRILCYACEWGEKHL